MVQGLENSLSAAREVGVRRFVYISSAVVHGFRPTAAVDETSRLIPQSWSEYAKNKVSAERVIAQWSGGPETVVLRPSIIYGPRSKDWSEAPARQIACGTAYLVDQGRGHMNQIHISHLLDAMMLVAHHPAAANQIYVVQDGFGLTWQDYYRSLCELLGVEFSTLAAFTWQDVMRTSSKFVATGSGQKTHQMCCAQRCGKIRSRRGSNVHPARNRSAASEADAQVQTFPDGDTRCLPPIAPELSIALLHTYPQPLVDAKIRNELGFTPHLLLPKFLKAWNAGIVS